MRNCLRVFWCGVHLFVNCSVRCALLSRELFSWPPSLDILLFGLLVYTRVVDGRGGIHARVGHLEWCYFPENFHGNFVCPWRGR